MKIVTAAEMALVEQAAQSRGISVDTLMENAGLAVAQSARSHLGTVAGANILALVGPGNNGADGLVAAPASASLGGRSYRLRRNPAPQPRLQDGCRAAVRR